MGLSIDHKHACYLAPALNAHQARVAVLVYFVLLFLLQALSIDFTQAGYAVSKNVLAAVQITLMCFLFSWPFMVYVLPILQKERHLFFVLAVSLLWIASSAFAAQNILPLFGLGNIGAQNVPAMLAGLWSPDYARVLPATLLVWLPLLAIVVQQWTLAQQQQKSKIALQARPQRVQEFQIDHQLLFSFINTIYALNESKPHKARELILLFSDLLRYQLSYHNIRQTSLRKESAAVEMYLTLLKAKFAEEPDIHYSVSGSIDSHSIPALALTTVTSRFIALAFNLNVAQPYLHAHLDADADGVYFFLEGNAPSHFTTKKATQHFGDLIELVRIQSPDDFQLDVQVDNSKMNLNVTIRTK